MRVHALREGFEEVEYIESSRYETCTAPVGREIPSRRTKMLY